MRWFTIRIQFSGRHLTVETSALPNGLVQTRLALDGGPYREWAGRTNQRRVDTEMELLSYHNQTVSLLGDLAVILAH